MKKIFFMMLVIISIGVFAQAPQITKVTVSGTVLDGETGQPLEYATITLQNSKRTQMLTGGITNEKGKFEVETFAGTYNIKVEYISFKSIEIKEKNLKENFDMGVLKLYTDSQKLDEVKIVAEKRDVEIRLDKKIYNVGKDLTIKGGTFTDLLENIPSVTTDAEGTVSLRGNDNVRILIDGKPSGLVGLSSTDALRQLPADAIESVEVITSPSARYDAEGTAGIINIILKKGKITGLNGSFSINTGTPDNYGANANLNFRTKKINLFNTTSYNYTNAPGNSENKRENFFGSPDNKFINEFRTFDRIRNNFNTNLGLEYFLTESSSIVGSVFFRGNGGKTGSDNFTNRLNESKELVDQSLRREDENQKEQTVQYSLNYTKKFKTDGHQLTADFQSERSFEDQFSNISDRGIFPIASSPDIETNRTDENQDRILAQLDYVLPFGKNLQSQFEAGYRGNFNQLTTDFEVDTLGVGGELTLDANLSNKLIYEENINAFYTQLGSKFGKFSILLGLRTEISDINVLLATTNKTFNKNYTDYFPTINIGYEFNDEESLTLGFNRRITRPRSRFVNPFPSRSSETNLFQGNPDLNPSYSSALDLAYLKRWEKLTLTSSVYYQRSTGVFEFISEDTGVLTDNGDPIVRRFPVNLSTNKRVGFEFSGNYTPIKWWRINGNLNVFNSETNGDFDNVSFDANTTTWFTRLNSRVTLPGKIDFQQTVFYSGPSETAQNERKSVFTSNLALSKDILKEKASLVINVRDLFNSGARETDTRTSTFFSTSNFQFRKRQITLTFTYRFNQKKNQRERNRQQNENQGGGEEEFGG
ncbi:MAG: TonB-dependent receptor [Flavobacteriales bacterium CG_4_9_14_3_um_filter_40_17]|nr:MAG: TonB-dependent receptor [Flavobacteriales bacterium CG_4_9_14_3_um_filter_40_17]